LALPGWGFVPARRADAEELEPVALDAIAGPSGDLARHLAHPAVIDFGRAAAAGADDVMVMLGRLAGDVGVLARRQVEALYETQVREQLQGSEHGRTPDRRAPVRRIVDEVAGREVAGALRDQLGNSAARLRAADAGLREGLHERMDIDHAVMIPSLN
jgi:hypothetical protein